MSFTLNPFTHELLAIQREKRLARKAAVYQAVDYKGRPTPSARKRLASALRAIANRLAQPEPAAAAHTGPNHIHIRPEGQPRMPSEG